MKIITGLEPMVSEQRVPETVRDIVFERGAVLPVPTLRVQVLYIIEFRSVLLERTIDTMVATKKPEVEKKGLRLAIVDSYPKGYLEDELRRAGVPDDAYPDIISAGTTYIDEYRYVWWEVTL